MEPFIMHKEQSAPVQLKSKHPLCPS